VKSLLAIPVAAALIGCVFGVISILAQAPDTAVLPIFRDYDRPPSQIDLLMAEVDAVAVVRIEQTRFESPFDTVIGRPHDVTRYDVCIIDTIKPHAMLPPIQGRLTLTRPGGQHTESGRIVRSAEKGFEDFRQNGEYVLFLTWNTHTNQYDIAYGPNGAYELDLSSGLARPLGKSEVAMKQLGKERSAFLNQLRATVR
jgi:hypothetical protein